MGKVLFVVLLIGVGSGCVLGDAKCFLMSLSACSEKTGQSLSSSLPNSDLCKNRKEFFDCVREKETECSVNYNLDDLEAMYKQICTDGTPLHQKLIKYQGCIVKSAQSAMSCIQDIIDFAKKFPVMTPEAFYEVSQLVCKERDRVMKCYSSLIKRDCGSGARDFIEEVSKPSNKVNEKICHDILKD